MKDNELIIINGGNPLNDCPTDYEVADKWAEGINDTRDDEIKWKWDCGFKLDFDGPLVSISSRFYPPKTHYGPTWDGAVHVYLLNETIHEKRFDCPTLEALRKEVEDYVEEIKKKITERFLEPI